MSEIGALLNTHNVLGQQIKSVAEELKISTIPNQKIVIHADKYQADIHPGRANAQRSDELAVIVTGNEGFLPKDIVFTMRGGETRSIDYKHKWRDALSYPLRSARNPNRLSSTSTSR